MSRRILCLLGICAVAQLSLLPARRAAAQPAVLAQPAAPLPRQGIDPQRRLLALQQIDDQIADARSLKLGGMLLTFFGIIATAVGAGLMPAAYERSGQTGFQGAAWATLMVGLTSLPVGLPFWVMGSKREKEYRDQKTQLILSVAPSREASLVHLGFTF